MSTNEPQTTMVAHAFDNGGVQHNLLIASISPFACAGDDVDDSDLPDPKGLGLWLWRDTGSESIMPTEFDEDGGVRWSGDWVRPDHEQALALASGVLPWSKETVVSAIVAERDLLLDRVRQLDDQLLDAHCDRSAANERQKSRPSGLVHKSMLQQQRADDARASIDHIEAVRQAQSWESLGILHAENQRLLAIIEECGG